MAIEQCQWTDKPGQTELLCHTILQPASKFCPRHTYLHNVAQQQKAERELEQRVKRKAPSKVTRNDRRGLIEAGLQFVGNSTCKGCAKPIEWWRNQNGNNVPYDPMPEEGSYARSHFASCTRAAEFRTERRG